jgi:ribonuclease Z
MSTRELVVLGTASQVPTRYRNHNGYLLRWDGRGMLFDPGEGTQRQMTRFGMSATGITRILVSHFHGDHCLGLAGIVQRISLDEVPHTVDVHYPRSGQVYFDRLRHASIFKDKAKTRKCPVDTDGVIYEDDEVVVSAQRLDHGVDTYGYRVEERGGVRMLPAKLAELGVRGRDIGVLQRDGEVVIDGRRITVDEVSVAKPGQVFAFVMDTRLCDAAFRLAKDADLLVCESTYLRSEQREARDHGHMTATEAATIAKQSGVRSLVLTHFSQRYPDTRAFLDEARPIFENSVAARDGDVVPVPKRR